MSSLFLNKSLLNAQYFGTLSITFSGGFCMRILALITEYNPFHNGHIYHIESAKALVNPDVTIAIMSGNFTQRGELAITDKFTRTKACLKHVDLVCELPFLNAVSFADDFARGGVHIAGLMGATDLVFGSESGDIVGLRKAAKESNDLSETEAFHDLLRAGKSYPRAMDELSQSDFLSSPNNTLGIAYIKMVEEMGLNIRVDTTKRTGNHYSDQELSNQAFSSATSIRRTLFSHDIDDAKQFMPSALVDEIMSNHLASNEDIFTTLKTIILTKSLSELRQIYMMTEGLEYRLKDKIKTSHSYSDFISQVKTKRYTWTRLSRLMIAILMNITNEIMKEHRLNNCVRVLGMNKTGQAHLKSLNEVEIITNVNKNNRSLVSHEVTATEVYNTYTGGTKNDFNTPVIIES